VSGPAPRLLARRAAAAALDAALGFALAMALSVTPVGRYFALRAFDMFRIDSPTTVWKGPIPLILGAFGETVYTFPAALLALLSVEGVTGRSLGKRAFGLRVVAGGGQGAAQLRVRFALKTVGCWGFVAGLVSGSWLVALATTAAACVVLPSALAGPGLHDRIGRTTVVRG
jgi:hypothetical protein